MGFTASEKPFSLLFLIHGKAKNHPMLIAEYPEGCEGCIVGNSKKRVFFKQKKPPRYYIWNLSKIQSRKKYFGIFVFSFQEEPSSWRKITSTRLNYFLIVNQFRKTFSAITDHVLQQHRQVAPWTAIYNNEVLLIPLPWSKGYWGLWKTLI